MSYPAFEKVHIWTHVRALKDITTKNRTMKAGETGEVVGRYAYTVLVRPRGKKLAVETHDESALEIIGSDTKKGQTWK